MLNIENISKGFGDQILFDHTGFQISRGERVGLVGRNGHGKTTLLNMITGSDHPDEGNILCPAGYRIGFLTQTIRFKKETVLKEAMLGLPDHEKDHYWKAEKILAGLGFAKFDLEKDPNVFSGGYQVRLNLAKVLVSDPDLLILDEPTNYLDITSIRWITRFLTTWPHEVLLVTHDRSFMDGVVTHIAGIHRCKIKKIKGDTEKYYLQIAQDEEVYEKTRVNEEKKRKEIELFITRFRAKARLANMVQSRIKTLEKSQVKEKLQQQKQLDFSFSDIEFSGKQMMTVADLSFSYEKDKPLINDLSFTLYPGDRLAVIGQNGKGKTTLLKLLNQQIKSNTGTITLNPGVVTGYFEQTNIQTLNDGFTVEEEMLTAAADTQRQKARNICGAMMFEQDAALKKISVLSGGEKSRVMLGKLLMTPLNLLMLDEPSNHLDMEACDAFVEALADFSGAVILVTHNELFLHALANRLLVFKSDRISLFEGTYAQFLEKEGWEDEDRELEKKPKVPGLSKKELRQKKGELIALKSQQIKPYKKSIARLEDKIQATDDRIAKLNELLLSASNKGDGEKIQEYAKELARLEKENDDLFEKLDTQTQEYERIESEFDEQLMNLERIE